MIRIVFDSGAVSERRFPLKEATSSDAVLLSRLQTWLETIGFPAPAVQIKLSLVLCKEGGKRLYLWPHGRIGRDLSKLAREFKARFGYQPLKRIQFIDPGAILPERRFRLKDMLE